MQAEPSGEFFRANVIRDSDTSTGTEEEAGDPFFADRDKEQFAVDAKWITEHRRG